MFAQQSTSHLAFAPIAVFVLIGVLVLAAVAAIAVLAIRKQRWLAIPLAAVLLLIVPVAGLGSLWVYLGTARRAASAEVEMQNRIAAEHAAMMHYQALMSRQARRLQPPEPLAPPMITPQGGVMRLSPPLPLEAPRPRSVDRSKLDATSSDLPSAGEPFLTATTTRSRPAWLDDVASRFDASPSDDRRFVVVSGQQFADRATAVEDALSEAARLVGADFERDRGRRGETWKLGSGVDHAVKERFTEEIQRTAGDNEFTVYRTYLLVELSPQVRNLIEPIWREQISAGRSIVVAGLIAILTAFAGVISGYFRLDDRTGGRYRWRLRIGAVAALAMIGLTALAGTKLAADEFEHSRRSRAPATVAPSDARTSQLVTNIDDQDQERFREVADRIVEAINAADYEGVRQDFNKEMLDAFPVEECRTFFSKKISGKYGKINKLETPQFKSAAVAVFVARCERGTLDFTLVIDENRRVAGLLFRPGADLPVEPIASLEASLHRGN